MSTTQQLGIGLQYNPEILGWFPFEQANVDALEVLLDTIMGPLDSPYVLQPGSTAVLSRLSSRFALIAHSNYGCDFGFGALESTPAVRRHVALAKQLNTPWVAHHAFYGDDSWVDVWSSPLQFSRAEVKRVAQRARRLQALYGVPLALENAAYYCACPGSEMGEAEFLAELVAEAGTYLLLDLHNVYANSLNHAGYDADLFLARLPLERVVEIHLAGGSWNDGLYHDWHDSGVPEPVWDLLEHVLERCQPGAVVLEFQGRAHHAETRVLDERTDRGVIERDIERARTVWDRIQRPGSRRSLRQLAHGG